MTDIKDWITLVEKSKVYVKRGQKAPEGIATRRGKRGGTYYETGPKQTSHTPTEPSGPVEQQTSKRVVHDPNVKLSEDVTPDKYSYVRVGNKRHYQRITKIGDMEVETIPSIDYSDSDKKLSFYHYINHKSGGASTLSQNDYGKFIRLRVIAENQRFEQLHTKLSSKIVKNSEQFKSNPEINSFVETIDKLSQQSLLLKEELDSYPPDDPTVQELKTKILDITKTCLEMDRQYIHHPVYVKYEEQRTKLNTQLKKLNAEQKESVLNKIFEFIPEGQKAELEVKQDNNNRKWRPEQNECSPEDQKRIFDLVSRYLPLDRNFPVYTMGIHIDPNDTQRSHCKGDLIFLDNGDDKDEGTIVHEFGHCLEHQDRNARENSDVFYNYRTESEERRPLKEVNSAYKDDEFYKKDEFFDPYCGKDYGEYGVSELISMGLQKLHTNPVQFAQEDGEYFDMIVCCLYGERWLPNGYS
jgi:hypothetical protein